MTFQIPEMARYKKRLAALIAAGLIITQSGCGNNAAQPDFSSGEDYLLNTYCTLTIYEPGREDLIREAFIYARSLENLLSRTIKGSEVSAFNRSEAGQPVSLSPDAAEVIERGLYYSQLSEGLFDVTLGALTELWNFSAAEPSVPSETEIATALKTIGYRTVRMSWNEDRSGASITKENKDTHIDLGGIAKGYIADRVKDFLAEKGVGSALINFGGNVLILGGKEDGTPWLIGVEKPYFAGDNEEQLRELSGEIAVTRGSVVTSGSYERKFTEDGKLYYHILDPATGYPRVTDVVSVTVTGPVSADCDALSTICLMLGLEKGLSLIEGLESYEAVFIAEDGGITVTSGAQFTPYDDMERTE